MKFNPMSELNCRDGVSFLVMRCGNDAADFLIQQVQIFEEHMYPDQMGVNCDYSDAVHDAVGWCHINAPVLPVTIEHKSKETSE